MAARMGIDASGGMKQIGHIRGQKNRGQRGQRRLDLGRPAQGGVGIVHNAAVHTIIDDLPGYRSGIRPLRAGLGAIRSRRTALGQNIIEKNIRMGVNICRLVSVPQRQRPDHRGFAQGQWAFINQSLGRRRRAPIQRVPNDRARRGRAERQLNRRGIKPPLGEKSSVGHMALHRRRRVSATGRWRAEKPRSTGIMAARRQSRGEQKRGISRRDV